MSIGIDTSHHSRIHPPSEDRGAACDDAGTCQEGAIRHVRQASSGVQTAPRKLGLDSPKEGGIRGIDKHVRELHFYRAAGDSIYLKLRGP